MILIRFILVLAFALAVSCSQSSTNGLSLEAMISAALKEQNVNPKREQYLAIAWQETGGVAALLKIQEETTSLQLPKAYPRTLRSAFSPNAYRGNAASGSGTCVFVWKEAPADVKEIVVRLEAFDQKTASAQLLLQTNCH